MGLSIEKDFDDDNALGGDGGGGVKAAGGSSNLLNPPGYYEGDGGVCNPGLIGSLAEGSMFSFI